MHECRAVNKVLCTTGLIILFFSNTHFGFAQTISNESETSNEVNQELVDKRNAIEKLSLQIEEYEKKISEKVSEKISLNQQLEILQNRMARTELQIKETNAKIDLVNLELVDIEKQAIVVQEKLEKQREMISVVLQNIQVQDQQLPMEIFFGNKNFSDIFDNLNRLSQMNKDLKDSVESAKATKKQLLDTRASEEKNRDDFEKLHERLSQDKMQLDSETDARQSLLFATKQSESRFRSLLNELKQEQDYINQQIQSLQSKVEKKIGEGDQLGNGSSVLSWPLNPNTKGVSAYYHDVSYPFRYLFEHSGIDLPSAIGTPVKSAGPGYVAWTRTGGKQYGNYIMIIHSNGLATLYAHLSRINVVADQFVARGDMIGAVGMTGLTTGPHLHFEVRLNGIPTDPMNYLE